MNTTVTSSVSTASGELPPVLVTEHGLSVSSEMLTGFITWSPEGLKVRRRVYGFDGASNQIPSQLQYCSAIGPKPQEVRDAGPQSLENHVMDPSVVSP